MTDTKHEALDLAAQQAERGSEIETLFKAKPMPTRLVELMEGRKYLVQGLTHGEKDEIEQGRIEISPEGEVKRDSVGKASEYVARGLRHPDGSKASVINLPGGERHDSWKALAERIRTQLSPADVDILYLAILDLSGITKAHQEKVAKLSGLTPTA